MFLLSFIGFLLVTLLIVFFFLKGRVSEGSEMPYPSDYNTMDRWQREAVDRQIERARRSPSPSWMIYLKNNSKVYLILLTASFLLFLSNWLFFWAIQGHQYYLVYPTGGWSTTYTPGIKWRGFATIQEWQREIDIKVLAEGEDDDGIEGVIHDKVTFMVDNKPVDVTGIHVTFIDRVNAAVRISVRMTMPKDDASFRAVAESFRSQNNLINNTLIPTIREQLSNVGYQFAAQDYISGAATDFRQAIDDQMKNGGYSTERKEFNDTVYSAIQEKGPRTIKEISTRYKIIRNTDKDGKLIRIPHEITKNKIEVSQVIIDAVEPEPAFKKRLEAQRDISAQKRIEMEKIETAKAEQQRVVAEGERDKAKERVEKEKEQVGQLIAIETQLKQEDTKRQLAQIALQTEKLNAEKLLVTERAQAEANRLKVAAGLTPQERAYWQYRSDSVRSAYLSKIAWPATYIDGGSSGKGGGMLETLIGADLAKGMLGSKKD